MTSHLMDPANPTSHRHRHTSLLPTGAQDTLPRIRTGTAALPDIEPRSPSTSPRVVHFQFRRSRRPSQCRPTRQDTSLMPTTATTILLRSSPPALAAPASMRTTSSQTSATLQCPPPGRVSPTAPTARRHRPRPCQATALPTRTAAPALANAMASLERASASSSTAAVLVAATATTPRPAPAVVTTSMLYQHTPSHDATASSSDDKQPRTALGRDQAHLEKAHSRTFITPSNTVSRSQAVSSRTLVLSTDRKSVV